MSAGAVADWSVEEVHTFILNGIGGNVGKYADLFQENGVSGSLLIQLEDSDLVEIGVKNAIHRKKILNALRKTLEEEADKPKRGPELLSKKSINPDTNPAILKSALRGCLLSLNSDDQESVLSMMSTILGNELTANDRAYVIEELEKENKEEDVPQERMPGAKKKKRLHLLLQK